MISDDAIKKLVVSMREAETTGQESLFGGLLKLTVSILDAAKEGALAALMRRVRRLTTASGRRMGYVFDEKYVPARSCMKRALWRAGGRWRTIVNEILMAGGKGTVSQRIMDHPRFNTHPVAAFAPISSRPRWCHAPEKTVARAFAGRLTVTLPGCEAIQLEYWS